MHGIGQGGGEIGGAGGDGDQRDAAGEGIYGGDAGGIRRDRCWGKSLPAWQGAGGEGSQSQEGNFAHDA